MDHIRNLGNPTKKFRKTEKPENRFNNIYLLFVRCEM